MDQQMKRKIETAEAKALATTGPHGVNVVPVSIAEVFGGDIYLYDFYMNKTAKNIKANSAVALTCWAGLVGIQIKAEASYETDGPAYEGAVVRMRERFPDRALRAVVRLTPTAVYDVTPEADPTDLLDRP